MTYGRIVVVETKGQEDLDVPLKIQRIRQWCEDINGMQSDVMYDFEVDPNEMRNAHQCANAVLCAPPNKGNGADSGASRQEQDHTEPYPCGSSTALRK